MRRVKYLALLLTVAILLSAASAVYAKPDLKIKVEDEIVKFDALPFSQNNRTMVPIDSIFKRLGAEVKTVEKDSTLWIEGEYASIKLTLGNKNVYVYMKYDMTGKPLIIEMDAAPRKVGKKIFVPIRFVAEALGYEVEWNRRGNMVIIRKKGGVITPVERPVSYKKVNISDINQNKNLTEWYQKNYQKNGILSKEYENKAYVIVSAGERPTGGYTIEMESATMVSPKSVYITAMVTKPAPDAMVTQAITYPHLLIELDEKNIKNVDGLINE